MSITSTVTGNYAWKIFRELQIVVVFLPKKKLRSVEALTAVPCCVEIL